MSDFEWANTNAARAAIGAVTISAIAFGWALVHAIRIEEVPVLPAPQFASAAALSPAERGAGADIEGAVQADLFAADRTAPSHRYRIPGEDSDEASPAAPAVLPVVLGTAVADQAHSFATVQLGDGHAVIMHVGDKIGGYTVAAIEREKVVFLTSSKKKLDISELKP